MNVLSNLGVDHSSKLFSITTFASPMIFSFNTPELSQLPWVHPLGVHVLAIFNNRCWNALFTLHVIPVPCKVKPCRHDFQLGPGQHVSSSVKLAQERVLTLAERCWHASNGQYKRSISSTPLIASFSILMSGMKHY